MDSVTLHLAPALHSNKESSEAEDPEKQAFLRAVRKECRGLVFCKRSGRCISRRFHKCHHITELPKEDWPDITQTQFSVLEKMSGLLVAPYVTEGKLRWAGRTGVTKTSDVVEEFVASTEGEYAAFAQTWIDKGFTPLFNWYHPDMPTARTLAGRVVVDNGDDPMLTLIALRDISTGRYMPYHELLALAPKLEIVQPFGVGFQTLHSIRRATYDSLDAISSEGCVVCVDGCAMFKFRTMWYAQMAKRQARQQLTDIAERRQREERRLKRIHDAKEAEKRRIAFREAQEKKKKERAMFSL